MSRLKLSAVIVPFLSLGVACSGFACASKGYIPKLPGRDIIIERGAQNSRNFNEVPVNTPRIVAPESVEDVMSFEDFYSLLVEEGKISLKEKEFLIEYDKILAGILNELKFIN